MYYINGLMTYSKYAYAMILYPTAISGVCIRLCMFGFVWYMYACLVYDHSQNNDITCYRPV